MEYYGGNILANAAWASNNRWEALWDDFRKPIDSFGDLSGVKISTFGEWSGQVMR